MKKCFTLLLSIILSVSFAAESFAQTMLLSYDGKVHKYIGNVLQLKVNNEVVPTDIPPIILNNRSLVPVRAVFEKLGANVNWDAKNKKILVSLDSKSVELKVNDTNAKVNNKTVKMDVPAKIINDRTMIPLRFVGEQLDLTVGWHPDKDLITIDNKKESVKGDLKGVTCNKSSGSDQVAISVDDYENYNVFRLSSPDRIVVDIPYTEVAAKNRIDVNSLQVKSIRYAQFDDTTARVVLDVVGQPKYEVDEQNGRLVLNFEGSATSPDTGNSSGSTSASSGSLRIDCSPENDGDEVAISLDSYKNYKVFRLTGPDRIVADIPGVRMPDDDEHSVNYSGSVVKGVRYSKNGANSLRVVLDVQGQPEYSIDEKKGKLVFNVENSTYRNITYHNTGDRVYFSIGGAELTEGGEELKKFYSDKFSSNGRKYTITFPSNLADVGEGEMKINDSYLESIEIDTNTGKNETSITFNAKDKFFYEIITRYDVDDTAISILKPASKRDKLVVIDPGHGGREPGASYGGIYEKDLNLDIALRLNALLKKKNVKTYMTRQDDSFVGLYERAYIANNLNASLFLSIHNNAIGDPNYGGTMTLYFPQKSNSRGFNGKRFAEVIQGKLLSKLGTKDRKIIERPKLVVLKASVMPSALAEVAFMTNKPDMENLKKEEFRQKAAEALCEAILQSLKEVN